MPVIPQSVRDTLRGPFGLSLGNYLQSTGFTMDREGKVRQTFTHPDHPNVLFPVATDRISIFDFVLNCTIEGKGEILTALTHYWMTSRLLSEIPNQLIQMELPRGLPWKRCLSVRALRMISFELIFRYHLGGSVWSDYLADKPVGGVLLPPGMKKWSKLEYPLFTPTTKAVVGNDLPVTSEDYFQATGEPGRVAYDLVITAYQLVYAHALRHGIRMPDTKVEVGEDPETGLLYIGDELFTPDSSRLVKASHFVMSFREGHEPAFYDKEHVRDWGRRVETPFGVTGINNLDPEIPDHVEFVHSLQVPRDVLAETRKRYLEIFKSLTELTLVEYQQTRMRPKTA